MTSSEGNNSDYNNSLLHHVRCQIFAVKKIDSSALYLSVQTDEDFLDAVSNISRLRHANITELVGYCVEAEVRSVVSYGYSAIPYHRPYSTDHTTDHKV